ncbi:hypothetical protein [Nostoc sp. WHI]|uniref:hypothetical protein n=1 Tax=Nostoc sp. WHI TaxID=2650611 RepID=UPI0018C6AC7A|nr:hypothetical protein [Nostoc sp. WHI]
MWKSHETPNPLTPFPTREGGKLKVSLLRGERFRERFSRYREKSAKPISYIIGDGSTVSFSHNNGAIALDLKLPRVSAENS